MVTGGWRGERKEQEGHCQAGCDPVSCQQKACDRGLRRYDHPESNGDTSFRHA